jgi:hypothetical protein
VLVCLLLLPPAGVRAAQYALLVGVGKYANSDLKALPYPEGDIRALYYALRGVGYRADHRKCRGKRRWSSVAS